MTTVSRTSAAVLRHRPDDELRDSASHFHVRAHEVLRAKASVFGRPDEAGADTGDAERAGLEVILTMFVLT